MADCTKFDAADYLDSEEAISEFLLACAGLEDPDLLVAAMANVEAARKRLAERAKKKPLQS